MNWTKKSEPNNEVPYNHTKLKTPIGEYIVDWKGWKGNPSYDISLKGEWLGAEYDLESAKSLAENHLLEKANQINGFIKQQLGTKAWLIRTLQSQEVKCGVELVAGKRK